MGNKQFWNTVKPFLAPKDFLHNEDIALNIGDKTATDCNELAKKFNEYYINIVQNPTGEATIKLQGSNNDKCTVETNLKPISTILILNLLRNTFKKKTKRLLEGCKRLLKLRLLALDKLRK